MLSKLRIRRNRLRPVKPETLARWWLYETNSTPVELQDGNEPPQIHGDGCGWETITGIPIRHPKAYAKKGWSSMIYRASTKYISVGKEWLRERDLAPYSSEAGSCHIIPCSKRVIHGFEVWLGFSKFRKIYLVKKKEFEFHLSAFNQRTAEDAVREAIKNLKKQRQEKLIEEIPDNRCWVTINDSLKSGNCEFMTLNFASDLYKKEGGEIGAIRADRLREIRNDSYTGRAINKAKERLCVKE